MINGITKNKHGIADLGYIPLVLAAPKILGFNNDSKASLVVRSFAVMDLCYSLLTNAKWGAAKVIPYKTHAALDLASGVLAAAAPWIFGIAKNKKARNTLFAMAAIGLAVGALSLIGAKRED